VIKNILRAVLLAATVGLFFSCGVFDKLFGTIDGTWEIDFTVSGSSDHGTCTVTLARDGDVELTGSITAATINSTDLNPGSDPASYIGTLIDGDIYLNLSFTAVPFFYSWSLDGTVVGRNGSGTGTFSSSNPAYDTGAGTFTMTKQ
jgi:hypothetical protein